MEVLATLFFFAAIGLMLASYWKVFEKADRPGWYALIPIWNLYQVVKIAGLRGTSMLLFLIPFVNLIYAIVLNIRLAEAFGQSKGFGVGLSFLGFLFWPLLGFGPAEYLPLQQAKMEESSRYQNDDGDWVEEVPLSDW